MPTGMRCLLVSACHRLLAGRKYEVQEAWNGPQCNEGTVMTTVGGEEV